MEVRILTTYASNEGPPAMISPPQPKKADQAEGGDMPAAGEGGSGHGEGEGAGRAREGDGAGRGDGSGGGRRRRNSKNRIQNGIQNRIQNRAELNNAARQTKTLPTQSRGQGTQNGPIHFLFRSGSFRIGF